MMAELRKSLTQATETEQEVFFSTEATMLPASSRNSRELVIKLPVHIDIQHYKNTSFLHVNGITVGLGCRGIILITVYLE